ncbi:uncharacterized protein [Patagioenas fasciata]
MSSSCGKWELGRAVVIRAKTENKAGEGNGRGREQAQREIIYDKTESSSLFKRVFSNFTVSFLPFFACIILASGIKHNCLANALYKTCTNEHGKRPTASTEGTFASAYERATRSLWNRCRHSTLESSSKGNRGSLYCSLKLQLKSDWIKLKEIPLRGQPCWKLMSTSQRQTLIHEQKPHVLHNAAPNVARQSKLATAQEEVITAPQLTILGQETSLYTSLNPPSQGKPPRPPLVSNEKQEFVTLGSSVLVKATQHLAVLFPTDVLFC